MAPLDETSTIAKFLDKRGPGIQQLAFRVSDIDVLSERLREQGVRLVYDAPRRGTANSRINFIHPKDAGGVLIELVERAQRTRRTNSIFGSGRGLPGWSSTACANGAGPRIAPGESAGHTTTCAVPNGFRDRIRGSGRS